MREMKDSGIEWIGEIPSNSLLTPLKYLSCIIRGGSPRPIANFLTDEVNGYNWIKIGDTVKNSKYITKTKFKINPSGLNNTRLVKKGSLLLTNSMSFGEPYILQIDGCIHDGWVSLFDFRNINQEYLYYCLISNVCRVQFERLTDGGVVQNLNIDKIASVKVVLFNLAEQERIVKFLDTQCSEIDATAEDIQKEISLLEDYKKSVITEAVTKGLNPDAEMKDSGVKWLPKIPKHWKVIPSKYLFANSDIRRQTGDEQLTASQKYGIITQKDYTAKENAQVVLATQGLEKWKHVEPNDFIISLRSFQGGLEMSEITGCITWHYVVLKAQKEVYHKYYKWLFKSARYINALQGTCNFIRDGQDLRFSNFALVPLFELPLEEQQQIADYLDTKCSEIDTLITDKKRQLDILADYKKSLIYEYVTGKKEVPVNE